MAITRDIKGMSYDMIWHDEMKDVRIAGRSTGYETRDEIRRFAFCPRMELMTDHEAISHDRFDSKVYTYKRLNDGDQVRLLSMLIQAAMDSEMPFLRGERIELPEIEHFLEIIVDEANRKTRFKTEKVEPPSQDLIIGELEKRIQQLTEMNNELALENINFKLEMEEM